MAATWSTTDLLATTLALGNLRATATASAAGVRANTSVTTGKYYFEYHCNLVSSTTAVGIANASAALGTMGPTPTNAALAYPGSGTVYVNNVAVGSFTTAHGGGTTLCVALDLDNLRIWFRTISDGNWNGNVANDPATNTGGYSISAIAGASTPVFPAVGFSASTHRVTANFGASYFMGTPPAGFVAGYPDATANPAAPTRTTWSATDTVATYTNPTATSLMLCVAPFAATAGGVRAVAGKTSGKFYFEYTPYCWYNSNTGIGIANAGAILNSMGQTPTNACMLYTSGAVYVNNSFIGSFLSGATHGDVIGIALDLNNRRIWFKNQPSGNWNGNASYDPATNVGGIDISAICGGGINAIHPAVGGSSSSTVDGVAANFGDLSFVGTTPSGFTAGFPTGSSANIAAATQVVSEQWINFNAQAQLTQLILEEWAAFPPPPYQVTLAAIEEWTLSGSGVRAPFWVTQTALEEWTVVPAPPLLVTQVAIEHWTTAATLPTSVIVTQAAIEHWIGETATVPTGIMGPMITTIF